jgi:hypothetical protein
MLTGGLDVCSAVKADGLTVSNKIIPMSTHRAGRSALDEFLPERALAPQQRNGSGTHAGPEPLAANEIQIDPIESFPAPIAMKPSPVQLWPMLAAALVALGASLLALAVFAKFFHTTV